MHAGRRVVIGVDAGVIGTKMLHLVEAVFDRIGVGLVAQTDTIALMELAKNEIAGLAKLPHLLFFGGGVVIKIDNEVVGGIGASGAPGAMLDHNCALAGLEKIRDRLK
jgi:uncharacterized protein GlcG (DUF336 family)